MKALQDEPNVSEKKDQDDELARMLDGLEQEEPGDVAVALPLPAIPEPPPPVLALMDDVLIASAAMAASVAANCVELLSISVRI